MPLGKLIRRRLPIASRQSDCEADGRGAAGGIDLADVLIDVDNETDFVHHLLGPKSGVGRSAVGLKRRNVLAALLACGCNLGPERMKVTNPELGFISANSWDINGAASAGLNTFWIQRSAAEVPEELGFQASAVVKAITDLAPLLRG